MWFAYKVSALCQACGCGSLFLLWEEVGLVIFTGWRFHLVGVVLGVCYSGGCLGWGDEGEQHVAPFKFIFLLGRLVGYEGVGGRSFAHKWEVSPTYTPHRPDRNGEGRQYEGGREEALTIRREDGIQKDIQGGQGRVRRDGRVSIGGGRGGGRRFVQRA